MSNVLISVPSEWLRYKTKDGMTYVAIGDNGFFFTDDMMYGDDSTKEKWNEFFNSCILGHMRIGDKIISSKKDLLR